MCLAPMNHYQSPNGLANIDAVCSRIALLCREHPDYYAVINTFRPTHEQAISLVDWEVAEGLAEAANRDSGTRAYIVVKASELITR